MIVDRAESVLLSNLGWVDRGSIWTLDVASGRIGSVALGEGRFIRLLPGREDLFAAQLVSEQHDRWLSISVRRASAPAEVVATWTWGDARAAGDELAWSSVPHVFVGYDPGSRRYVTVAIDPRDRRVSVERITWFDPESYDWGYQQPMTVTAVPGSRLLLYSVQRSSELVLYDPPRRRVERKISLAGSGGNPEPFFRQTAPELWVTDYDHILRLEPTSWRILDSRRLQDAGEGSRLFIGDFAFDAGERRCAVARPFSGDVLVLDGARFEPAARVPLANMPLDVALLSDGRVFARDWGTGVLLAGRA